MDYTDYEPLSDETLVLLGRFGDKAARDTLASRYFDLKRKLINIVAADYKSQLDPAEESEVYFLAFLRACRAYHFGTAKFRTYFVVILKNLYVREAMKAYQQRQEEGELSLDAPLDEEDLSHLTFHDVEYEGFVEESPAAKIALREDLFSIIRHIAKANPTGLRIATHLAEGFTVEEICERLSISPHEAKYELRKLRLAARMEKQRREEHDKKKSPARKRGKSS